MMELNFVPYISFTCWVQHFDSYLANTVSLYRYVQTFRLSAGRRHCRAVILFLIGEEEVWKHLPSRWEGCLSATSLRNVLTRKFKRGKSL